MAGLRAFGGGTQVTIRSFVDGRTYAFDPAQDTLSFGSTTYHAAKVVFVQVGSDLEVHHGAKKVTLLNVQVADLWRDSNFTFADGSDLKIGTVNGDSLLGTSFNDFLYGAGGNDTLIGGAGGDAMRGGTGDDLYYYTAGDSIIEAQDQGMDAVYVYSLVGTFQTPSNVEEVNLQVAGAVAGNSLANTLVGTNGSDTLAGGGQADMLIGGAGDDFYTVEAAGDVVLEDPAGGTDSVTSFVNKTLTGTGSFANVENLVLVGMAVNGTGNALDNHITGNGYNNYLKGLGGSDVLTGAGGSDALDGGPGADVMYGGTGNDTYYVTAGDVIDETGGDGYDSVSSSISWTLADGFEVLYLTGTAANGTGNDGPNTIYGDGATNVLKGLGGDDSLSGDSNADKLFGAQGNDYLSGASGNDSLHGGPGNDTLLGFNDKDTLVGGPGGDYMLGEEGEDLFIDDLDPSNGFSISGGPGGDTLRLAGGQSPDFGPYTAYMIKGLEFIDLKTDTAANHIVMSATDVQEMSDLHILYIYGSASDSVSGGATAGDWTYFGLVDGYSEYMYGVGVATLYLDPVIPNDLAPIM
jgi:Ca2+-binding RTX toxin-like protein